ncbi:DUF3021 family protein [Butyrivibrio sp. VCB2006]|uniref:DUF3021 family protein n=1 Tax=Butyrivibrio sp. VCB2006 TaxID=1280679 RepID=UPI00041D05B9|nr:DUF3021 family protein [Butyrivibrio sp. VCB2006]
MKSDKKLTLWEAYLTKEIGIEFKACLYFFAFLFFYCVFRMLGGIFDASILHMTEMIFTCYFIGYLQVYVFWNFDEADSLGAKEIVGMVVCTILYCVVSWLGKWFDRNVIATLIFSAYVLLVYFCVFLIYKSKRRIDDKKLNEELRLFQTQHKKSE